MTFRVSLINYSKDRRNSIALDASWKHGDLNLLIFQADGKGVRPSSPSDPGERDERPQGVILRPGGFTTAEFTCMHFAHSELPPRAGRYHFQVKMSPSAEVKEIQSPPLYFDVVSLALDDILVSIPVELAERERSLPVDEQSRSVVEQIQVGKRVWLFYRTFNPTRFGGRVSETIRIAELPGKVDMKVSGSYGALGPLNITYADKCSPSGRATLVINSDSGTLWTARNQYAYDFNHNIAPPPRAK